jgi:hypothetical protein
VYLLSERHEAPIARRDPNLGIRRAVKLAPSRIWR